MSVPNPNNFCGGAFDDWLEVMLTSECNGKCDWCIERDGFKPELKAPWETLATLILKDRASKVIFLGGEPTLYPDLKALVRATCDEKELYITTNGSRFNAQFVAEVLDGVTGINVSIHDWQLDRNAKITGIVLDQDTLELAVVECRRRGIRVRLNCNVIRQHVYDGVAILRYIRWAKQTGVWSIRFAELKNDVDRFRSLAGMGLDARFGLNEDPYIEGCNKQGMIEGVSVNFRQMCGLQTTMRPKPVSPHAPHDKRVLYYDGQFYDGWQTSQRM